MEIATLRKILNEKEIIQVNFRGYLSAHWDCPLQYLSIKSMNDLFLCIEISNDVLSHSQRKSMPDRNIVSLVWEELTKRCIDKSLLIFL